MFCVAVEEQGALLTVKLENGAGGVGFTLEGGKGSIHGDKPLVIKKILTGTHLSTHRYIHISRARNIKQVPSYAKCTLPVLSNCNMLIQSVNELPKKEHCPSFTSFNNFLKNGPKLVTTFPERLREIYRLNPK